MKLLLFGVVTSSIGLLSFAADVDSAREALRKLNEFIGEWKGVGGPDKTKLDPRDPTWKESISWSWKFKGNDAWLTMSMKEGNYFKGGELRYLPEKKQYEFVVTDNKDQKLTFTGKRDDKGYLSMEREDPTNGDTQQLIMNSAGDGVRFVYRYAVKPKGRTVFNKIYQVAATKEGEALAAKTSGKKGNECIVTGGLGTIAVSYKGQTYYVCCSGCKEAFEENPEKYINAKK